MIGIKEHDPTTMNDDELLDLAKEISSEEKSKDSSVQFTIGKNKVYVKTGEHGPYIMIPHGSKKPTFVSIPKNVDYTKITATKVKELIDANKNKKF